MKTKSLSTDEIIDALLYILKLKPTKKKRILELMELYAKADSIEERVEIEGVMEEVLR